MDRRPLTTSAVMHSTIKDEVHISLIHDGIVVNVVLFISMGIEDCNLEIPHAGHRIENDLITPELFVQQCLAVAFVCERTSKRCCLLKPIVGLESHMLIEPHPLLVLHQPHNHLLVKVSSWIVGMVLVISSTHSQGSLYGQKHTVAIPINLKIKTRNIGENIPIGDHQGD